MSKTKTRRTYTISHRCGAPILLTGRPASCRRPVHVPGTRCPNHFLDHIAPAVPAVPDRAITLAGGAIPVDHPSHYNHGTIEAITVIEDWALNFNMGNALKYISRADHKGTPVADIQKAIWYLNRELDRRKA